MGAKSGQGVRKGSPHQQITPTSSEAPGPFVSGK
jgi:hypothetical protein